jgi:hypothetical protein
VTPPRFGAGGMDIVLNHFIRVTDTRVKEDAS